MVSYLNKSFLRLFKSCQLFFTDDKASPDKSELNEFEEFYALLVDTDKIKVTEEEKNEIKSLLAHTKWIRSNWKNIKNARLNKLETLLTSEYENTKDEIIEHGRELLDERIL